MRWHLILLFVPALAFAANPVTLETRSQDHAMVVDVIPVGDDVTYSVRVTDLHSGELIASAKVVPNGAVADSFIELRDMRIHIKLRPAYNGLFASVEITKGDTIIDSMDARWSLKPSRPPGHLGNPAGVLHVGGDVKAPIVVTRVEPAYTDEARKAHISGIVILEVLIDKNGDVREANVLKPLPFGLDQAAIDAIRQWKFRPATKNGEPVDVIFSLTVNFKLDIPKPPAQ
jgi:TonB family protein